MYDFAIIVGAYLIGAIPFGYLIPRLFGVNDIRTIGSGNVGATNAYRAAGPAAGILVLILDIGKGIAVITITRMVSNTFLPMEYLILLAGLAAILGHIFTIFLSFRGGKGVNTALGVMITILTFEVLAALIVFIIVVSISRYISLGSILASFTLFAITLIETLLSVRAIPTSYLVATLILMFLILLAHRSNIRRLLDGNENRFSLRSKSKAEMREGVKENV
jgi:acyl phosphate:glycerol-3-phosphate acyltransferase